VPAVRNGGGSAVLVFDAAAAGSSKRIHDGFQLRTHRIGEFALQLPHAVAALLQLDAPTVLLQLIIDRFRPIGIGGVDDP
jgi:hypothetical protein